LASTALLQYADAYRTFSQSSYGSPFVGEHADADVIASEGRMTHRATPVADKVKKYDSIHSKHLNKKPRKSPETRVWEAIFGEPEEEKPQQRKHHSNRLGAQQVIIEEK